MIIFNIVLLSQLYIDPVYIQYYCHFPFILSLMLLYTVVYILVLYIPFFVWFNIPLICIDLTFYTYLYLFFHCAAAAPEIYNQGSTKIYLISFLSKDTCRLNRWCVENIQVNHFNDHTRVLFLHFSINFWARLHRICWQISRIQTTDFWPLDVAALDLFHAETSIVPTGCDALIIFTSAMPRLQSYTNMINTPAGRRQNSLALFVSVCLPDVKSINYLNLMQPTDWKSVTHSGPQKLSAWRNQISSEWYSELFSDGSRSGGWV